MFEIANFSEATKGLVALPKALNHIAQVGFALQANRLSTELTPNESVALQRQPYLRIDVHIPNTQPSVPTLWLEAAKAERDSGRDKIIKLT